MTYNRNQAKALLTADEYELFTTSLPDRIGELDQTRLHAGITRARTARNKYRDLATRQNIATGTKAAGRAAAHGANERTAAKATVFAETLARFAKRLERMQAADARASHKADSTHVATTAARPATPNRAERRAAATGASATRGIFMSASAEAQNSKQLNGPTAKSISAHRSAVGRRNQAKRDGR